VHLRPLGAPEQDPESPGDPRVDYDVPHEKPWGTDMVLYLFMKAVATGAMLVAAAFWLLGFAGPLVTLAAPALSIIFIGLTAAVLVIDLERPQRFFYILTKPNWRSWMVWGAWFLTAHGVLSAAWLAAGWFHLAAALDALAWPVLGVALLATSYTGFLFAQGLARDLWQGPTAAVDLIAQSGIAGSAALLVCGGVLERHPKLRVVLYHAGGAFPSLVGRLDKGYELFADLRGSIPRKPSSYVGSFWLDTLAFDETVLRQLIERFTAERFVIGTDYPLPMGPADPVGGVRALGLDAAAEAAILGGNARELLRL